MYPLIVCCVWMWYLILMQIESPKKSKKEGLLVVQQRMGTLFTRNKKIDKKILLTIIESIQARRMAGLSTIIVLGTVAPLLGLLGTVTGMISTFEAVSSFGLGNARAMAEGISEAMITTRTGLVIAIPGLLIAHFIRRKLTRQKRILERAGLRILQEGSNSHEL
ncbi:MAG: MotA/TolQ/ExbB proton channel family protein [Desulfobacteraceae bacterium]